jgi:cation diffusion facilitator family transporter
MSPTPKFMPVALTEKQTVAQKTTWVSVALNLVLMAFQIAVGVVAHSQALIADGVHSLADLFSDFIVLTANRHSSVEPDSDHNYGHSRYETVASLLLGALLLVVGAGMLWRAGTRLTDLDQMPAVHVGALIVAAVVLVSKEALFRYMLREAQRVRSAMLIANAWHARSDAASSLVVAIGIAGSLFGLRVLDPVAAAVVGFLVGRMGWTFAWDAVQDLSDRALDESESAAIREALTATPGVRGVHELRTRKMGDLALVDAHILVDPLISVSEGHYIAESARLKVLERADVLDALIHVDPENDELGRPAPGLPVREQLTHAVRRAFDAYGIEVAALNIHYLRHGIDMDVMLAPGSGDHVLPDPAVLGRELGVRQVRLFSSLAETPAPADLH